MVVYCKIVGAVDDGRIIIECVEKKKALQACMDSHAIVSIVPMIAISPIVPCSLIICFHKAYLPSFGYTD